jgi:polysaccharide biosynthesis/export protein
VYSVRLHDLMKRGDISANVEMMPGDILSIPEGWF